jgi:hypothetical protein
MKWWIPLALVLLAGCSSPPPTPATMVVSQEDAVVPGAPTASLVDNGISVSGVSDIASIAGSYFTPSGGSLEISPQGQVKIENMLEHATASGTLLISAKGAELVIANASPLLVSRQLLGLRIKSETLLRQDGKWMFRLPSDESLVGRFVSPNGGELISRDGKLFDYLPSKRSHGVQWRRYMHSGRYTKDERENRTLVLHWLNATVSPEDLQIAISPPGVLMVDGEAFSKSSSPLQSPGIQGSFKDARGNVLSIESSGKVSFELMFPNKANKLKAEGRARNIDNTSLGVFSEQLGPAFGFTVHQLAMGHILVSLPASAGSFPLVLMAPVAKRKDTLPVEALGMYLNPEAYDISIDRDGKLLLAAKQDIAISDDMRTPGAVSRTLIGVELHPKGAAKLYYTTGPALVALVQPAGNSLQFYFVDYQDQPLYQSKDTFSFEMEMAHPQDGFRHAPVPTLGYAGLHLRHYPTASQDILAEAYEAQERLKDEQTSAVLEADPAIMLSKEESQAERERRMRRREDGRNAGDPTPDVGAFYVSKHQARVMEMKRLGMELTSLPPPRNAFELRANMQKDKQIRERAAQLHVEEEKERETAP